MIECTEDQKNGIGISSFSVISNHVRIDGDFQYGRKSSVFFALDQLAPPPRSERAIGIFTWLSPSSRSNFDRNIIRGFDRGSSNSPATHIRRYIEPAYTPSSGPRSCRGLPTELVYARVCTSSFPSSMTYSIRPIILYESTVSLIVNEWYIRRLFPSVFSRLSQTKVQPTRLVSSAEIGRALRTVAMGGCG